MEKKITNLIAFCQGIYKKENARELYDKYLDDIENLTPQALFLVMNEQLEMGLTTADILTFLEKILNIFNASLEEYKWEKPKKGTFLFYLMEENKGLLTLLENFKIVLKNKDYNEIKIHLIDFLHKVNKYNDHLLKLENILFPYMEKRMKRYEGLKIMWAVHNDLREELKKAEILFKKTKITERDINIEMGQLYFKLYGVVHKQDIILFPAAVSILNEDEFYKMHLQSFDFEFPFIMRPEAPKYKLKDFIDKTEGVFKTETGTMTFDQLEAVFAALPVDITFVNEYDKVEFFSRPKDRIFPRTPAIIGRDVRNCHPADSVHVVEEILESFKDNKKDTAAFWIQMKGMFILIQYYALRNSVGKYMGTLEVSQDVSEIRSLKGEKRLLDK